MPSLASIAVQKNKENILTIPPSVMSGSWVIVAGAASHIKYMTSYLHKKIPTLKIGSVYRFTYELFDHSPTHISCYARLDIGTTKTGIARHQDGVYTDTFLIESDLDRTIRFIANGISKIRNFYFEEKYFTTNVIPFTNTAAFHNKSFTRSYSFYSSSFIGHHSYLPDYYISQKNNVFSKYTSEASLYRHNEDRIFQTYKGVLYPFVVEYVANANPLATEVLEDVSIQTRARRFNTSLNEYQDERDITFNKITAYNSKQSTGEVNMVNKDTKAGLTNWYTQQVVNQTGNIVIARREKDWNINQIRDNVINYNVPLFSSAWNDIKGNFFIDKVVNPSAISTVKAWNNLQSLRDKYVIIRLKFDNFNEVNLSMNFSIESEQPSPR